MMRVAAAALVIGCVIVSLVALSAAPAGQQKLSLRPLVVHEAQPEKLVKHGVEWSSGIDSGRRNSMLVGPRMYSTEVHPNQDASELTLFGWYELPPSDQKPVERKVQVSLERGDAIETFELGDAAYFLSKTQQLLEGKPPELPDGLSQFVAYRIVDGKDVGQRVKLTTGDAPEEFELKRPVLLCVPAEEWHHDEYFAVKDSSACWIVYEIAGIEHTSSVSTLDQFGFNKLNLGSAKWVCVPSTISQ